jgi:hypothetical protein
MTIQAVFETGLVVVKVAKGVCERGREEKREAFIGWLYSFYGWSMYQCGASQVFRIEGNQL